MIKPWQDAIEEISADAIVNSWDIRNYMQAEIDELRTELRIVTVGARESVQKLRAELQIVTAERDVCTAAADRAIAENARLKANIETRKSNYNRLKAMVDDGSISDRTFSLCEELEKENARLRDALTRIEELDGRRMYESCMDCESETCVSTKRCAGAQNSNIGKAARAALGEKS